MNFEDFPFLFDVSLPKLKVDLFSFSDSELVSSTLNLLNNPPIVFFLISILLPTPNCLADSFGWALTRAPLSAPPRALPLAPPRTPPPPRTLPLPVPRWPCPPLLFLIDFDSLPLSSSSSNGVSFILFTASSFEIWKNEP